jgi:Multiubiquitin
MLLQTKKAVVIYVEGVAHEWREETISYEQVVALEVPDFAQHPEVTYSVKYTRGRGDKPEGTLNPGGAPVKVKEGMVFSVSQTGQS